MHVPLRSSQVETRVSPLLWRIQFDTVRHFQIFETKNFLIVCSGSAMTQMKAF
jgi:hypothetical protein